MQPRVFIFSAPSGSGKTTIVKHLLAHNQNLGFSISVTTRNPREGKETDGKDYYFWSTAQFKEGIKKQQFVEWEKVYADVYYGTLRSEVERLWSGGKYPVFDVDVRGGVQLKKYFKSSALAIFIRVKDMVVLEQRLRNRDTETESSLKERLEKAELELDYAGQFDTVLVNDELGRTLQEAQGLVESFIKRNQF